jgi:hypothetical protein
MIDMIPRAEADARLAAACEAMRLRALDIAHEHLALVQPHDPDDPHPEDKVAQGYGNAALNISAGIRALTPDDDRAALDAMLAEVEKRGEKRGMLRAAEIVRKLWASTNAELEAAIRAEAGD